MSQNLHVTSSDSSVCEGVHEAHWKGCIILLGNKCLKSLSNETSIHLYVWATLAVQGSPDSAQELLLGTRAVEHRTVASISKSLCGMKTGENATRKETFPVIVHFSCARLERAQKALRCMWEAQCHPGSL